MRQLSPLRVELLGGFRIVADDRAAARVPSARQQQILAFLVLHSAGAAILRQRVAGSLWPESTDAQALTNLRRELHHLREEWPAVSSLIEARSRTLAWRGDADVTAFESAAGRGLAGDRGSLQAAAHLYKGDVLPDCAAEWIAVDRTRLRQRAVMVLSQLIGAFEHDHQFGDAIAYAEQLTRMEPLREDAWRALMRCHARRGERAAALHAYEECAAVMKRELGVQPSASTRLTYREILDLDEPADVHATRRTTVYALVGRDAEWRAMLQVWREAEQGRPRMLVIRGEAGIGKTRLAEELVEWCGVKKVTALSARCYAGEGRLAYAPIAAWLKADALQHALESLEASVLSDVARLHPDVIATHSNVPAPDRQLESWQRVRFFDALAQAFTSAAPLVLVLDDLQWADAETLEWIQYFLQTTSGAHCLVVGTIRAEEEQDNVPLGRLLRQLAQDDVLTVMSLGPLDFDATAQLARAVAEQPLDAAALARMFSDTEGHPLFIVERGRIEAGARSGVAARNALSRVQSVVAARLALLSPEGRVVSEVAAAIGRDFAFDVLAAATDLDEAALVGAIDELWRRHIVREHADGRWDFSHDRIREVAYGGIGPARAPLVHRRIAAGMRRLYADRLDEASASIAMHLDRGGRPALAIPFLQHAAEVASRVSANGEAIRCLTHALALLERLPGGPERDDRELTIRSRLSMALNFSRGYADPEVERNLDRVFTISRRVGDGRVPVRWLWVAFTLRYMLGDLKNTLKVAEQALTMCESDPSCRCDAHHAMGGTLSSMGRLADSKRHFESALAAYDEQHPRRSALGSDLGVFAHAWSSHTFWLLGDDGAAVRHAEEGIALARRLHHLYSETLALAYAGLLHQMRRDTPRMLECADAVVRLCDRYGFAYYGDWARVLIGWARGQEHPSEGLTIIEAALARLDANRAQARRPYYMSLLADTYRAAGHTERAADILDRAIELSRARLDTWWLPALYVQKSALGPPPAREATFRLALELAREQGSLGLEQWMLAAG